MAKKLAQKPASKAVSKVKSKVSTLLKAAASSKKAPPVLKKAKPRAAAVKSPAPIKLAAKPVAKAVSTPVAAAKATKVSAVVASVVKPTLVKALLARPSKALKLLKREKIRLPDKPVRLPPPPVTSNSKMAKNRAGLTARELEHFRDLLLEKRRELLGDVSSMERDALQGGNTNLSTLPLHMADTGTDNYEQEFTLGLVEKDRQLLREIQVALAKIQDGSYGICEGTGKPITKPRLEAQPWAKHGIEHARSLERPQFRRAF